MSQCLSTKSREIYSYIDRVVMVTGLGGSTVIATGFVGDSVLMVSRLEESMRLS